MSQSLLDRFGTPLERVDKAIARLRQGRGVLLVDDEDRENEGDLIFPAETITPGPDGHDDSRMQRHRLPVLDR